MYLLNIRFTFTLLQETITLWCDIRRLSKLLQCVCVGHSLINKTNTSTVLQKLVVPMQELEEVDLPYREFNLTYQYKNNGSQRVGRRHEGVECGRLTICQAFHE